MTRYIIIYMINLVIGDVYIWFVRTDQKIPQKIINHFQQGEAPPVRSWFINPLTIVISPLSTQLLS